MRHLPLLTLLLLAFWLRVHNLATLPLGFYHDEAYNGLDALALTEGASFPQFHEGWELYAAEAHATRPPTPTRFPLFFEGNYGREPLHIYLMAISVWLFGNTPFAVRLVPALSGVVAVAAVYLVAGVFMVQRGRGAEERRRKIHHSPFTIHHSQLFAAWAFAILFPAVHFSHFGLRMMLFIPVECLCVYFFWRGIVKAEGQRSRGAEAHFPSAPPLLRSSAPFLISGFLLGFGLYIYAAGRMMPFLFALFVPLWFALDRAAWRRFWQPVGLMAAVSLLTAAPLLLYFWQYPYFLFFRSNYVATHGAGVVADRPWLTRWYNLGRVVRGIVWQGETHFRHNLPARPLMDSLQSVLLVLGLTAGGQGGRGAEEQRSRGDAEPHTSHFSLLTFYFLLLWLVLMLLPSILSSDAPHFGRLSGAYPVVAIFIGRGAAFAIKAQGGRGARAHGRRVLTHYPLLTFYFLLFTFTLSTTLTMRDYFGRYAAHPLMQSDFYVDEWRAGQAMAALDEGTAVYLAPTQQELATFLFALGGRRHTLRNLNLHQSLLPLGWAGQPIAYFLRADDAAGLAYLQQAWGTAAVIHTDLRGFTQVQVAAAPATPLPLADFGGEIALVDVQTAAQDGQLHVTLTWQATAVPADSYTAFVHLLDAQGEIVAQLDRPPAGYPTADWRPGERIRDTFTLPAVAYATLRTGFYHPTTFQPVGRPWLAP